MPTPASDNFTESVGIQRDTNTEQKTKKLVYNLFDRFINIQFEGFWSLASAESEYQRQKMSGDEKVLNKLVGTDTPAGWQRWVTENVPDKWTITTPLRGIKPDISVAAVFLPNLKTTQVTVTIKNMECEIDISRFAFMSVALGYSGNMQVAFSGAIINSYIESPNPNGKTVFQLLDGGYLSELMLPRDIVMSAPYNKGLSAIQMVWMLCNTIGVKPISEFPFKLDKKTGEVWWEGTNGWLNTDNGNDIYNQTPLISAGQTKTFKSAQECLNWIDDSFKDKLRQTGIGASPLSFVNERDGIFIGTVQKPMAPKDSSMPVINYVTSASFTGGGITVTAPYNPSIQPLYRFMIDPKYFRGRFNGQVIRQSQIKFTDEKGGTDKGVGISPDSVYTVTQMQLNFGTYSENSMRINAVMSFNEKESLVLQAASERSKKESIDGLGGIMPQPYFTPSGYNDVVREDFKDVKFKPPSSRMLSKDDFYKRYSSYPMKEGETLEEVFGKTIAVWCIDDSLGWQDDNPVLYNKEEVKIKWKFTKESGLVGKPVYYPKWLTEGGLWSPGNNVTNRSENGNETLDAWKLRDRMLSKITVDISMVQQAAVGDLVYNQQRTSLSQILSYWGGVLKMDGSSPLIKSGKEVVFKYGYNPENPGDEEARKKINIAFDACGDYFDLYAYMVENEQFRETFKTDAVFEEYKDMIKKARELGADSFFISGVTISILTMMTQNRWWREGGYDPQQLFGYDHLNYRQNDAILVKTKKDISEINLTMVFPDLSCFFDKEAVESIIELLHELEGWCYNINYSYNVKRQDLNSDIDNLYTLIDLLE